MFDGLVDELKINQIRAVSEVFDIGPLADQGIESWLKWITLERYIGDLAYFGVEINNQIKIQMINRTY